MYFSLKRCFLSMSKILLLLLIYPANQCPLKQNSTTINEHERHRAEKMPRIDEYRMTFRDKFRFYIAFCEFKLYLLRLKCHSHNSFNCMVQSQKVRCTKWNQ